MPATRRLPDGRIETGLTIGDGEELLGDGIVVLKPGDEGYDELDAWLRRRGE